MDVTFESSSDDEVLNPQAGRQLGDGVTSDIPYTIYTVEVESVLKGQSATGQAGSLEVKILGGTVDGVRYVAAGAPEICPGEDRYLLFLEEYGSGIPASPLNYTQAILVLEGDQVSAANEVDANLRAEAQRFLDASR